jgi:hypothetical protein
MTDIRTRKPTGRAPWPLVLLEGEEKSGKTYAALALSASDKVGVTYAFDLGEGSLDEYAALGPFEIIDHDGSYRDFVGQLEAVLALPVDPAKPTVVVIDSMSALWSALSDEATESARRSKANAEALRKDPDAEVTVTMDKWNVAKRKWRRVMDQLMAYPGIVVVTARGKEVAIVEGGKPRRDGAKEWKVEGEKSLAFDASCWVRLTRPRRAALIGVRSLTLTVPEGREMVLPGFSLEKLVFEQLGLTAANTAPRQVTVATSDSRQDDAAWLTEWRAKVVQADTLDALRALYEEMTARSQRGGLTDDDRVDASALVSECKAAMVKAQDAHRLELANKHAVSA